MSTKGPAAKWRAEKPTRTNTGGSIRVKTISQPIPFPDDDEFPIRTPGSGMALPLGPEALEREIRLRASAATEELHPSQPPHGIDPEPVAHATTFSTDRSLHSAQRRTNVPSTLHHSDDDSIPSGLSVGKPERKKSSFKSVISRLFGKKKKSSSPPVNQPNRNGPRNGHRSDPSALNRNPPEQGNASKRSASLPINEFNRALRSHSIVAQDIPQSVRSSLINRDSVQSNVQRRSRRATTPSRLWTPNKIPGYVDWTGLSPRPASTHARNSAIISDTEARQIGTAVTSGGGSRNPNRRRSRSLGEIRNTAGAVARRRSDEIKYWRESYDAAILSPVSSHRADEPILVDEYSTRDVPLQENPQPFNFGPLGALTGMKITEVASLEMRVQRLENRMLDVERGNQRSGATHSAQNTSRHSGRKSSIPRPKTRELETSIPMTSRFREQQEQMYLQEPVPQIYSRRRSIVNSQNNSYYPYDPLTDNQHQQSADPTTARPLSTSTTLRGLPSSPSRSRDGPLTVEHFTTLNNLLITEKSARQNLEALVISLQDQIRGLQSPRISALNENLDPNTAFSTFERYDSSDDFRRGRYGDESEEVFETPMEISGSKRFGDEIFGGAAEENGTPRTLSLSQITMNKAGQYAGAVF